MQPAAGDSGSAIGAASFASWKRSVASSKIEQAYPGHPAYEKLDYIVERATYLLNEGNPDAWCRGRMEFEPRALGGAVFLDVLASWLPSQRA